MQLMEYVCPCCGELNLYGDAFDNEDPSGCIKCGYEPEY